MHLITIAVGQYTYIHAHTRAHTHTHIHTHNTHTTHARTHVPTYYITIPYPHMHFTTNNWYSYYEVNTLTG